MIKKITTVLLLLASVWMLLGADLQTDSQEECPHSSWKDGVCTECGAEPEFYEVLPDKYFEPCPEPGELVNVAYDSRIYYSDNEKPVNHKKAIIYVPYAYDPETKYDVMVLVPGNGPESHIWMNYPNDRDHPGAKGRDIIDNLIYLGELKPMIFVMIDVPYGSYVERWAYQIACELRYVLLPMVCSQYSTYAEEPTSEGIVAAREHFALGGCSNGGIYVYGIGLMFDRDIFSKVMALSPKLIPKEAVEAVSKEDDPYELQMLYVGAGDREGNTKRSKEQYDQLLAASPWLEEGRNAFYTLVIGGHNWPTWRTHLVNALQMFF